MALPYKDIRPSGKVSVRDTIVEILTERGRETIAGLHGAYKEALKVFYADRLEPFLTFSKGKGEYVPYARPYRVRNKKRQYIKKPPKGMTYLSFARYIYKMLEEGLVVRDAEATDTQLTPEQLASGFRMPVYYKLR